MREVIGLVADLPDDGTISVTYTYLNVDEYTPRAAELGEHRSELHAEQKRTLIEASIYIATPTGRGYSVRDVSGLLQMSPGRVSQIMLSQREAHIETASLTSIQGTGAPRKQLTRSAQRAQTPISAFASTGLRSRNRIPGIGKSGTLAVNAVT
ncbi:MAG: hypothetical protein ACYCZY_12765 [Lacisediminihabitans sp.]